jgi:hypothetical protein
MTSLEVRSVRRYPPNSRFFLVPEENTVPQEIVFPDAEPSYVFDRDVLAFRALADGKPVQVMVTGELLMSSFGARDMTEASLRDAYQRNRDDLRDLARTHIQMGWVDEQSRVFLTTRYTRLHVTFGDRLSAWSTGRILADTAHRLLVDLIGPSAGEVVVEWGVAEDGQDRRMVTLDIRDPAFQTSVQAIIDQKEFDDPSVLELRLARIWGTILQMRSHRLSLKSG